MQDRTLPSPLHYAQLPSNREYDMLNLNPDTCRIDACLYEEGSGFFQRWTEDPEPGPCPPSVRDALSRAADKLKGEKKSSTRYQEALQDWWVDVLERYGFTAYESPAPKKLPSEWAKGANEALDKLERAEVSLTRDGYDETLRVAA